MYEIYRKLRDTRGVRDADVVKATGIPKSTFAEWKSGRSKPKIEKLQKIAGFFDVPVSYFFNQVDDTPKPSTDHTHWVPVLGRVAAGIPAEMVEDVIDYEEIDDSVGEAFALVIAGDSMEPLILKGDTVIVRRQEDVESGDVAIVAVNGEDATCKRITKTADGVILQPQNPVYAPAFYSNADILSLPITILGRVIEIRRKL